MRIAKLNNNIVLKTKMNYQDLMKLINVEQFTKRESLKILSCFQSAIRFKHLSTLVPLTNISFGKTVVTEYDMIRINIFIDTIS